MCGRFNVANTPGLQRLLDTLGIGVRLPAPRFNIAPTEDVLLLRPGRADSARWWLTPAWAPRVEQKYAMFNARCETLSQSRAFQRPFRSQRGIVPMSAFIEWRKEASGKQPWAVSNEAGAMAVAALWDLWRGEDAELLSCTLVTTATAEAFRPWHTRMPVLLDETESYRWLDCTREIADDDPLFAPVLKYPLVLSPLSRAVGNARNKDPALMEATGDKVLLTAP